MASYSAKTALLGNLIDYAGTFPPAALSLENAMKEACGFRRRARHPWLLAKVVVTITDLAKLSPRAWFDAGADGTPLPLTVIGSAAENAPDLIRNLDFEMREIRRFNEKSLDASQRQFVVAYETKLPNIRTGNFEAFVASVLSVLFSDGVFPLDIYFEIPFEDDWQFRIAKFTDYVAGFCQTNLSGVTTAKPGLKIRTGGKTVPTSEQLAEVVAACTLHGVRVKATQGLHHAITRPGDFGFVNLFAALAFAHVLGIETFDVKKIAACLDESDPKSFRFSGNTLTWKEFKLEAEQIEAARRRHGGTFGSCSLAEPDEFLTEEFGQE